MVVTASMDHRLWRLNVGCNSIFKCLVPAKWWSTPWMLAHLRCLMLIIDTTIRAIRELVIAAFPPPVPSLPPQTLHQAASHGREEKHEDRKQHMWCRDASNKIGMIEPTAKLGTITENYTFLFNKPVILGFLGFWNGEDPYQNIMILRDMDFGVGLVRLVGSGGVLNHSGHESPHWDRLVCGSCCY